MENQQREEFEQKAIQYFEVLGYKYTNPFPLYSKSLNSQLNKFLRYDVVGPDFTSEVIVLNQPCARVEDFDSNKKGVLPLFHQLTITDKDTNKSSSIKIALDFLFDFCGANPEKFGVVSTKNDPNLDVRGIEPYISLFTSYGIKEDNILLREARDVIEEKKGSGFWEHPYFPEIAGSTYAMYYYIGSDSQDIKEYDVSENWIEVAEAGCDKKLNVVCFGMERIGYTFFNIPYPDKKLLLQKIELMSKEVF